MSKPQHFSINSYRYTMKMGHLVLYTILENLRCKRYLQQNYYDPYGTTTSEIFG